MRPVGLGERWVEVEVFLGAQIEKRGCGGPLALWIADLSLVLQSSILALLFVGLGLKLGGKHFWHDVLMLSALVLHTASILLVMVPSLKVFGQSILTFPSDRLSLVSILSARRGHGCLSGHCLAISARSGALCS